MDADRCGPLRPRSRRSAWLTALGILVAGLGAARVARASRRPIPAKPAGARAVAGGQRHDRGVGHRRPAQPGPRRPAAGHSPTSSRPLWACRDCPWERRPRTANGSSSPGAWPRTAASRPPPVLPARGAGRGDPVPDPGPGRADGGQAPGGRRPRPGQPRPERAGGRHRGPDLGAGERRDLRPATRPPGADEVGGRAEDGVPGDRLARAEDTGRRHHRLRAAPRHQLGQPQLRGSPHVRRAGRQQRPAPRRPGRGPAGLLATGARRRRDGG